MKKFYEYANISGYPCINEVTHPNCPLGEEDPHVFLIYAETKQEAFQLAMAHIFDNKPIRPFYGSYQDEMYHGEIQCVL